MPKKISLQSSFAKGEISQLVQGRVDTTMYKSALKTAENVLVRPYGLIMSRPGLQYMGTAKNSDEKCILIPFIFNVDDTYMVECGAGYFRFWDYSGQVVLSLSDVDDWATTTSYVVGDFVKESSIIYYCLEAHSSGTFATDLAADKWVAQSIYEVPNDFSEAELTEIQYAQKDDIIDIVHPDYPPAQLKRNSGDDWDYDDITFYNGPYLDDNTTATTITPSATTGTGITLTASTAIFYPSHVGSMWKIGGTAGSPAAQGYVRITAVTSGPDTEATADVVSTLDGTAATDEWAEGAWSDRRGYPGSVTYHEQRKVFARTDTEPQKVWMTKSFEYDDFEEGSDDDDGINIEIAASQNNQIKWLSSLSDLMVGTVGGEFKVTGSGEAITPSNISTANQSGWGSKGIVPIRIGNYLYYVQSKGMKVRELYYLWEQNIYKSVDTTILSEHITGDGINYTSYQQDPDSTLHCVRDDGDIASLTREIDQEVVAWTRLVTDGNFEAIASIPHPTDPYDEVWVLVNRTIDGSTVRYIEKFVSPIAPDRQEDCFYVDSGLTYDAYAQTTGNGLTLSAKTGDITITADSSVFTSDMVNRRIRAIDSDGEMVGEARITELTSGTVVEGTVTYDFDATTYAGELWGISVDDVSGLSHLEGEDVAVLGDGAVQVQQTVASGSITLDRDAFELSVGLPYDCIVETLPPEVGNPTSLGAKQSISEIFLKVYKTLGMQLGRDADNLNDVRLLNNPTMGEPTSLYTGTIDNIRFNGSFSYDQGIYIKQSNPLPMHILDIVAQLEENRK